MTTWYATGTIAVANGGTTVTGTDTDFVSNAAEGEGIRLPNGLLYEITDIASATSLTISPPYEGTTVASGGAYKIAPMQGWARALALQAAELLATFGDVRDTVGAGMFGDGTLSAPGMRFLADPDTGVRRKSSNTVAIVGGGGDVAEFGTAGASTAFGGVTVFQANASVGVNMLSVNGPSAADGSLIGSIARTAGSAGTYFFVATGSGANAAASTIKCNAQASNSRGFSSGGSINASGADPAEYHYKAEGCPAVAKGQVVGLDAEDRITTVYADAIDFGIKSSDPSTVGGDRWGSEANILAVYGVPAPGERPQLPPEPTPEQISEHAAAVTAWQAAADAFNAALELERQKVDRISHGGGRLPCIVAGEVVVGQYVVAQDDGAGGIEAVCAATVADADRWRIVGRVRIAEPTEAQLRMLIREEVAIDPNWNAIVVQMKG